MLSPKFFAGCLGLLLFFILAGCGAVFINPGSVQSSLREGLSNPDLNKPKIDVPADQKIISNFDDGSKNMNSKLYGAGSGSWMVFSFAGNTPNPVFISKGGANGSAMAAHVTGSLTDKGDRSYPSFTLQGTFKGGSFYDADAFTGIQFYYKCPDDDQAIKRRFAIGTAPTLPPQDGGTCATDCYNHFGAYMAPTSDWKFCTYKFSDLGREPGWGSPVVPPDMVDHLKEFVYIKWDHGGDNNAGTYNIDYWVDEVSFF
jgi:hypothetical protein